MQPEEGTNQTFMDLKPMAYHIMDHIQTPVGCRFEIKAEAGGSQSVGFVMTEHYQAGYPLVGNAYVTEDAVSTNVPTTPGDFDTTLGGIEDGFAAKAEEISDPGMLRPPEPQGEPEPHDLPQPEEIQGVEGDPGPQDTRTRKKRKRIGKPNRITCTPSLRGNHVSLNKNIKKMIQGKHMIGLGSKRVVYDLGNGYVLKVAKSKDGIISNKKEVKISMTSPSEIRKHLGRILKHGDGYSWIIMKKYHMNFQKTKENMRKLFDIQGRFKRNRIIPYEISDRRGGPNYQNLRLNSNGEIVVIDYGNFKRQL